MAAAAAGCGDDARGSLEKHIRISVQPGVALPPRFGTLATRQPLVWTQLATQVQAQVALLTAEQFAAQPKSVLGRLGGLIVLHDKAGPGPARWDLEWDVPARGGLLLTNDVEEQDQEWLVRADQLTNDCLDDILEVRVNVQGRSLTLGDFLQGDRVRARRVLGPATIERVVSGQRLSVGRPTPSLRDDLFHLAPEDCIERSLSVFHSDSEEENSRSAAQPAVSEREFALRHRAVVCAPAGMGKSVLLRSVVARLAEARPSQWTLLCDLRERRGALEQAAGSPMTRERCVALLRRLFDVGDGDDGELELGVLDSGLEVSHGVALLFDGYDGSHFSQQGKKTFEQLLSWLAGTKAGVWVASRDECVGDLCRALREPEAFCLQGLTEEEQCQLWTSREHNGGAMLFRHHLASNTFFQNPRHMSMACKVFDDFTQDECKLGIRRGSLYEKFFDFKFKKLFERLYRQSDLSDASMQGENLFQVLQRLAVVDLCGERWQDLALPKDGSPDVPELVNVALEPGFGLLRVSEQGSVRFADLTFAEFFASRWLYARLQDAKPPVDAKLRALLDRVMVKEDFREVRAFLDDQLAVADAAPERWSRYSPRHPFSMTFLSVPVCEGLPWLASFLWRRLRSMISKKEQGAAFLLAVKSTLVPVVEEALRDPIFKKSVPGLQEGGLPLLQWALSESWLLEQGSTGPDLQHDARLESLLRLLISAGCRACDRRVADEHLPTVLHRAVEQGRLGAARLLLAEGCDSDRARLELLQSADLDGRTALHYAARRSDAELLALLIEEERRLLQVIRTTSPGSGTGDLCDYSEFASKLSLFRYDNSGQCPLAECLPRGISVSELGLRGTDITIDEVASAVRLVWRHMNDVALMAMAKVEPSEVRAMAREALTAVEPRSCELDTAVNALSLAVPAVNVYFDGSDWRALRTLAVDGVGLADASTLLRVAASALHRDDTDTTTDPSVWTFECDHALESALQSGRDWDDALVVVLCSWRLDLAAVIDNKHDESGGALVRRQVREAFETGVGALRDWALGLASEQTHDIVAGEVAVWSVLEGMGGDHSDPVRIQAELVAWGCSLVARAAELRLARDAQRIAEAWPQADGAAEAILCAYDVEWGGVGTDDDEEEVCPCNAEPGPSNRIRDVPREPLFSFFESNGRSSDADGMAV